MRTNRDLYLAVLELIESKADQPIPSLETYLTNWLARGTAFADRPALRPQELYSLLRDAFDGPGEAVEPASPEAEEFFLWKERLENQIRDLREMAQRGQLGNDLRYFGIQAPSGASWYNFDPCTYLECGLVGAFGGWQEGDSSSRVLVEGEVPVLREDGSIAMVDSRQLSREPVEMPDLRWSTLADFALCGQIYE